MAVFSKLLVATTLLSSFALAAPWGHTFTETTWTTVDVTTTIYIDDAQTSTSPADTFTEAPAAASTSAAAPEVISTPAVAAAPAPSAPSASTPESVTVPSTTAAPAVASTPAMTTLATSTASSSDAGSARSAPSASATAATDNSSGSVPSSASDSATCEGEGNACQGDITFYAAGLGACGVTNADTDHIIALPFEFMGTQSNGNPYCGRSVMIVNPANGNSVAATVEDKCMGCSGRSIDLTPALFDILSDNDEALGRIHGIDWWFTD